MREDILEPPGAVRVMIIAGEASGDQHGAKVVRAIREREPGAVFFGIGGEALRSAGVEILVDAADLAVVGITEIFAKIPGLIRGLTTAKRLLRTHRPDLLILVDFPDFNLHIAATAKRRNIPILYYISPQIWAWRSGRVKKIRERVDHMAVILPFEAPFYAAHGVPVSFVGHPLLDRSPETPLPAEPDRPEAGPLVGLLPGSRDHEVTRLLPDMLGAVFLLRKTIPGIRFVISRSPSVERSLLASLLAAHAPGLEIDIEDGGVQRVLARSTLVVAASGTVTLEATVAETPMVIIYRVSPISYLFGRALIRVKSMGLANLIAGRRICPELLQEAVTSAGIADTVAKMLNDSEGLFATRRELARVRARLGSRGASVRVADIALTLIRKAGKRACGR